MILDGLLLPSFRWYLRLRVNRVIDETNNRLEIEIRPFQLTKKLVQAKVLRYANEIAPSFIYFRLGYWLSKTIGHLLY